MKSSYDSPVHQRLKTAFVDALAALNVAVYEWTQKVERRAA